MSESTAVDILFVILLMLSVPLLVNHYLAGPRFSDRCRRLMVVGGVAWLFYGFVNEEFVYYLLGVSPADAIIHWGLAFKASEELARGNWPFTRTIPLSNEAYQAYLAFLYYLFGATMNLAVAINGWLAFWGGLSLARAFGNLFPYVRLRDLWVLLIVFFPSAVFWSTANMKEGFMYWSICHMFSVMLTRVSGLAQFVNPATIGGLIVAGILRPHIAIVWLCSCLSVVFFHRRKAAYGILLLAALPLVIVALRLVGGFDVTSPSETIQQLAAHGAGMKQPGVGSDIEYGEEGPIFFVSGFTAIFFRPFPWQIGSFRLLIASAETWTLTLLIMYGWLRMSRMERKMALRIPAVQAAFLVCVFFSIFFTYLPNEGLMVRQRVQMIPALLALCFVPFLLREQLRGLFHAQHRGQTAGRPVHRSVTDMHVGPGFPHGR